MFDLREYINTIFIRDSWLFNHWSVVIMANGKLCLFVFAACLSSGLCKPNMSNSYDTIVVGLGAAGVTAASTLAKAGRRVLGLEADDRIGGRVKTVPFGDGVVEVGAEWIHGTVNSRVYDAAVQHNVSTVEQSLSSEVFRSDGSFGNRDLFNELTKFCIEIVEQSSDTPEPLGQFVTARLMEYLKKNHPDVLKDQDFVTEFLEIMNLFTNNHESSNDWNDVTTHTTYEVLGGHLHASWHKHGYKSFFEILLNKYNGPGLPSLDIKLNKEVTQIKWPKDSTGDVEVVCKDGETFTARNVIVTVSVGVLKERYSQLFSPSLPQEKIEMIQTIPIGVMDKVILKFDQPWWTSIPYTFMFFLWKGQDKKQVSDEDYWTTRIFGCSTPMGSKNALTLWTSGEVGKLVETLPEDIVIKKSVALLRKFMGANFTIPDPTGMVRSTWYTNPFTRGSYSYDNLVMPQHPDARSVLRQPLLDAAGTPRVLFAGEATDLTHFSTVHGASDSGYREAMRLLPASKI